MELLIPVIMSTITSLLKKLSKKIGVKHTKEATVISLFILVVLYTILENNGIIKKEMIKSILVTFSMAIAYYEILAKRFINPLFKSFN